MRRLIAKTLVLLSLILVSASALAQTGGTVTYVYSDSQGTPLAKADANGNIIATYDYTPYGTVAMGESPDGPGYTGHVNDAQTNLVYMQARYYDPATGRFLSVDPVSPVAGGTFGFNRYSYASNNPILYLDPDGRDPCTSTADCQARLQLADAAVSRDASFMVHLFGGPIAGVADFVHGVATGNTHEAAEGAGMTMVTAVMPEAGAAKALAGVATEAEVAGQLTSNAARRQVMRDAGIPTSQQPVSQSRNASGYEYSYDVPKAGGGTQRMSVQQQTMDRSHPGENHWEAGNVKFDQRTGDFLLNRYGRPALKNENKQKVDY